MTSSLTPKLLSLSSLIVAVAGCAAERAHSAEIAEQTSTRAAQHVAFSCQCDVDACRDGGLYELTGFFRTDATSLRLRTGDGAQFVGRRSDVQSKRPVFEHLQLVVAGEGHGEYVPARPTRPADEALASATVTVDPDLVGTGPEYDGEEVPPSPHRSFGFIDVTLGGEDLWYTCEGLWREDAR